ncbi:MAG: hypothetical protein ACFFDC_20220, partial [Promethearchaeota archaeon]
ITTQRTYYQNQTCYFNLTINLAGSSIVDTSIKPFPELNNVLSEDSFEFWLIWQSEYNDFLNASDGVLINGTLNTHLGVYLHDTDASTGNHTFIFYYSGTAIFTYNLTFIIENYAKLEFLVNFNVYNKTMVIDNGLSNPISNQTIDFLQYGEIYYFYVFIKDNSSNLPLNTTILILPENVTFLGYTAEGNHSLIYNASQIGSFPDLKIVFTLQNYNSITYSISFVVSPREMILDSNQSTKQSIDYLQYGDIFYFRVFICDSRTGDPLNISTFSELPPNFYFENFSVTKGHLFCYQALERGNYIYQINFTKQHYYSYTHELIFNITKANSELIPSITSITTYYSYDEDFSFIWQTIPNPTINTSPTLRIRNTSNIIIQPSSSIWLNNIVLQSIDNGDYSFTVIADSIGSFVIIIYLYSNNFIPEPIFMEITINIIPMPTYEPQISYQSELIVGELLTISCNQWLSLNNENVPIDEFQVINDSLSIDYTPIDITEFSFIIRIDTENFRQGSHNLTVKIFSYGYENHSLNVIIEIIGRNIEISIEVFPKELVQGSAFIVKATLRYSSLQRYSGGFGSKLSLAPLEGVPVSFLVNIKYKNGTTKSYYHSTITNTSGEAEFTILGEYTLFAEGIESIIVTSAATASGKESTQSTPPDFFENHKFISKVAEFPEELIFLGILALLAIIGISAPISIYRIRKREQGQKIVKDTIRVVPTKPTPKVTPAKEIENIKIQPQIEDKAEKERIEVSVKEPKEKVAPSSWITLFPPAVSECEKEIRYLFNLVLTREGRWYGRTSYNFLLKRKTADISVQNLQKVYMTIPQKTSYFIKEKNSIFITEEGKRIASNILKDDTNNEMIT